MGDKEKKIDYTAYRKKKYQSIPLPKLFLEHSYPNRSNGWWNVFKETTVRPKESLKINSTLSKAHSTTNYWEYNFRDVILYALGIGCSREGDMRYVYENHQKFFALPTYITIPGMAAIDLLTWPGIQVDLTTLFHGEQYIEIFKPLLTNGKICSETRIIDVLEKTSGVLIIYEVTSFDDKTNEKLAVQHFRFFQVKGDKFGEDNSNLHEPEITNVLNRTSESHVSVYPKENQHILFRLSSLILGPIHIDPIYAKSMGFSQPIHQGLYTLGVTFYALIKEWAWNDAEKLKAMNVRFSSPVLPGQTLKVESWKIDDKIVFQVKICETGKLAISQGWIKFHDSVDSSKVTSRL